MAFSRRFPMPAVVAVSIFATYLLAARGPRNLFPLSVFDMYQSHAPDVVARVVAVDPDGNVAELDAYEDWACEWDGDLRNAEATCGPSHRPLEYVTRDQANYLDAHAGPGTQPVLVVSRAYRLQDQHAYEDCVLARCRARRR